MERAAIWQRPQKIEGFKYMSRIYKRPVLTAEQIQALSNFKNDTGRTWKAALRDIWMAGGYDSERGSYVEAPLMQLRNSEGFGPSWLNQFHLKEAL